MTFKEKCRNPLKPGCESMDIVVYIMAGSERLPICRSCWAMLSEQDIEWDKDGIRFKGEPTSFIDQPSPSQKNLNNVSMGVHGST